MKVMKQLELDFGMLTVEQQQRVDRFIVSEAVNAEKAEARIKRTSRAICHSV